MRFRNHAILVSLLLASFLLITLAACGNPKNPSEGNAGGGLAGGKRAGETAVPPESGVSAEAHTIYTQHCISCHGTDLQGRVGGNSNLTQVGKRLSKEQIIHQITYGGNGMIPFQKRITAEEIQLLADWLAAMK